MFQKMLQGGGGREIKSASGTVSGLYMNTLVSVDCGFKPTSIVIYADTYLDITEVLSVYYENSPTIRKTYYKYNGAYYQDQYFQLTPTENGFIIKQAMSGGTGMLNYIAMKE